MKAKFTLLIFLLLIGICTRSQNSDINYRFNEMINRFHLGFTNNEEFENFLIDLKDIEQDLDNNSDSHLINNINALYSFIGEIGPTHSNFDLTDKKLSIALKILNINEIWYSRDKFCMGVTIINLWDGTYSAFLVKNNSDCIVKFEYAYNLGKGTAGVGKFSSRNIYSVFGKSKSDNFSLKFLSCKKVEPCNFDFLYLK